MTFVLFVVFQATTEMYSTPNGAQEATEEGEASGGESGDDQGEWESDGGGEGGDDVDYIEEEEEEVEPPPPPARRGDPSSPTIQHGNVARRLLLLGSRRNALGPLLLRRLERLPSTRAQRRPSRPRLCPR